MSHSDTPQFASISHRQFADGIALLAAQLAADDWKPDYLIGVGRGGLVPGAYLSHASGHALLSVDLSAQEFGFSGALLERLAEKTRAVQNLIAEVPSERLQTALSELHRLHLEAVASENHVSQLEAQLARLNSIIGDPRLRGPPETPNDAFEYACALCLEGRLSQR